MAERLRRRVDALRSAIVPIPREGATVDATLLATLAAACRDQLRVGFDYADGQGRASTRLVEPQGLAHTGYRWYLVAWDPARDDWRTFRIDRIAGAPQVGAHFAPRPPPEGGDLRAYVSRSVNMAPHPEPARVILHAPRSVMAARIPPGAGQIEPLDETRCLLQCAVPTLDALVYWLMALDVEFDVLAPPALQDRLRLAGERLARSLEKMTVPKAGG